jgi:3-oxoacyl-[acyl-carrier-protein] synthase-1
VKRRVVITGLGIISCLGNSYQDVVESLNKRASGIRQVPEWEELGLRSTIAGKARDTEEKRRSAGLSKKHVNSMSDAALYCTLAAKDAIEDAALGREDLANGRVGCIVGSGIGSTWAIYEAGVRLYSQKADRISPYGILRAMSNTCSANISTFFRIGGRSYSISSACATSLHNIGHAFELIRGGALDVAIAGGGEEVNDLTAAGFCALRMALSIRYNDMPQKASRPFDAQRDGFVLSEGGGIVVLEDLDHAKARGAKIYGEVRGFWANCDGYDMVLPEPEGNRASECVTRALEDAVISPEGIDYINAHGTSTVAGDLAEIKALRRVFGDAMPLISSTKSMGGHSLGAVGAHEIIHCIGMMEHGFIAPSINLETLDPALEGTPIVTQTIERSLEAILCNSFGFGGTNAVVVLTKYKG